MIVSFVLVGFLIILVSFLIILVTQARLVWEELTPQELEALQKAVHPEPETEMVFSGSGGIFGSRLNWLASHLSPGVLLVDAKINGQVVTLVVDTGVLVEEPLLLYADAARARGVRLNAAAPPIQPPSPELVHHFPTFRGLVDSFELGDLVIQGMPVRVVAARHRLKSLGLPLFQLDGFLGISFLERFSVSWDLQRPRLEIRWQPVEKPGPVAPLRIREHEHKGERARYYYVEAFLDGQGPYKVLIDTGASSPLLLVPSRVAQAYGRGQGRFHIRRLKLGEVELEEVPAMNIEVVLRREVPIDFIILGTGLLKAQGFKRLTLDFLAGRLYAER